MAKTLGICLGASTISIVEVSGERDSDVRLLFQSRHEGNPLKVLTEALAVVAVEAYDAVAATGRRLRSFLNFSTVSEPEATEYALGYLKAQGHHFDTLVSCGAETFIAYSLDKEGKIISAYSSGKCASGTGEFFLQQIGRMNISVEEALRLGAKNSPFKVSGRCSVFCKSDCTHALNHGEPLGNVVSGLCEMMSAKIIEMLQHLPKDKIVVVGGVSRNAIVMDFLRKYIADVLIPKEAGYFEALGAALWAREYKYKCKRIDRADIFLKQKLSFGFLPSLQEALPLVSFKSWLKKQANPGDECVIGLDVGSTTTKAVIIRLADDAVVASVYLKTNGQPVEASRNCYRELISQLPNEVSIIGLGVTGSGRQIAGLHALTPDIINEIIAHARAAVYFDKDVDVILEIGGQDAKYTYLVNGVPCDYAMNEACSAGTGSFLEEASKEILGIEMQDIADIALRSLKSPNFSDQCAAFISSDIKTALHEGIDKESIVGGLVYSICMNYNNRVKGSRPSGKKIFMQGGVCYNRAVPYAMAALIQKHITVPPDPGLMGAFGVALEVKERLRLGLSARARFDLKMLLVRTVEYGRSFICAGDASGCDRKCSIVNIKIEGKSYPFGGACNKYYNLRFDLNCDLNKKDLVVTRYRELFKEYDSRGQAGSNKKTVGLNLSFLTYSLLPLYHTFFQKLGFNVLLPVQALHEGIRYQGAAFCYPAALAHGFFLDLLNKKPDYLFLPQVSEMYVTHAISREPEHQSTCFILQAEPYYLKAAFKEYLSNRKMITSTLNFSNGFRAAEADFVRIAKKLGVGNKEAVAAYAQACDAQEEFARRLKSAGEELLRNLRDNPEDIAAVIFGRPYNAFCPDMNMGIPNKFATRGIQVVPFDLLPYESVDYKGPMELYGKNLTWAFGQMILRAASFTQQNKQLFGVYITNFSCGPDSFLLTYFREIMKEKPSLTIEIDSHTADAGVNTRIEAFLDIVQRYRHLKKLNIHFQAALVKDFQPAQITYHGKKAKIISSDSRKYALFDPRVQLLIPSMGDLGTEILTAVFNRYGMRATALPVPDQEVLKYGRAYSSGKECLPLILTCGSLMKYLESHRNKDEVILYFMPTVGGNCRFSQYSVFIQNLINKNHLRNVALFSLTSENGYLGLGNRFTVTVLKAVIISDAMDDIRNTLTVIAKDREFALSIFQEEWHKITKSLNSASGWAIEKQLMRTARVLKKIPLRYPLADAKFVSLLGEIFIRKEVFSRQAVVNMLQKKDFIPRTAPVLEWLYYVDYLVKKRIIVSKLDIKSKTEFFIKHSLQHVFERRFKGILAQSGVYPDYLIDIKNLVKYGQGLVPLELTGEPIIVIGSALSEILHSICGVISIGPFNCLPTRVTEAVLSREMNMERKCAIEKERKEVFSSLSGLPFLSVEVDGNPLSGLTEARLEAFCLQAEKVHRLMQSRKFEPK
jgi:predicted CoA-substrate-specific enzyme activase